MSDITVPWVVALGQLQEVRAENERLAEEVKKQTADKLIANVKLIKAEDEIARLRQDNAEMRELLNTLAEGRALEPKP